MSVYSYYIYIPRERELYCVLYSIHRYVALTSMYIHAWTAAQSTRVDLTKQNMT